MLSVFKNPYASHESPTIKNLSVLSVLSVFNKKPTHHALTMILVFSEKLSV